MLTVDGFAKDAMPVDYKNGAPAVILGVRDKVNVVPGRINDLLIEPLDCLGYGFASHAKLRVLRVVRHDADHAQVGRVLAGVGLEFGVVSGNSSGRKLPGAAVRKMHE